jgi:hypothetical protein
MSPALFVHGMVSCDQADIARSHTPIPRQLPTPLTCDFPVGIELCAQRGGGSWIFKSVVTTVCLLVKMVIRVRRQNAWAKRIERSLPVLLRGQIECGIAAIIQRGVLDRGRGPSQHRIELLELCKGQIVAPESSGTFHLANDWIEPAVRAGAA